MSLFRSCPKCGHEFVATTYNAEKDLLECLCENSMGMGMGMGCGYEWTEKPEDQKRTGPGPCSGPVAVAIVVGFTVLGLILGAVLGGP